MRDLIALLLAGAGATASWAGDAPASTVDQQIAEQRACIARSDAMIKRQHEIGREAGVVDKNALYVAGADKVHCRQRLAALQACKKKGGTCAADPYAPTLPASAAIGTSP
jgi:hypothetical protein